jgi:O-antigen/teichoic acid export membrane protein
LDFYKKIVSTQLFKVTSLNSVSIFIKIGIGLVTSKILAVFIGPAGMGLLGNFRNFMTAVDSISTLGFQNGIVKYVAENENDKNELNKIITTLFFSLLVVTIVLGSGLFIFSSFWNLLIFGNNYKYAFVFKILALVLPWYVASLYLLSIINGLGKFKQVIYINSIGTIIGFIVTFFFILKWSVLGALLSIVVTPSLLFFVALYYIAKQIPIYKAIRVKNFNFKIIKNLSHYFLMAMVSGILGPIVFLAIRNQVITTIGLKEAGYWEAISRISTYYLLFVNTLLTVFYYPKLVIAKNSQETRLVFFSFYKNVFPVFTIGLILIFLLKSLIIKILFTPDFEPVNQLFLWQLLGDFLKVASWLLGLQFFAKRMTKVFIITEIGSLTVLYLSSCYFINHYKTEGIVMAHAFTYLVYFIVLVIYFRKILFNKN